MCPWAFQREQNIHQASPLESPGTARELVLLWELWLSVSSHGDLLAEQGKRVNPGTCLYLGNPKSTWGCLSCLGLLGAVATELGCPGVAQSLHSETQGRNQLSLSAFICLRVNTLIFRRNRTCKTSHCNGNYEGDFQRNASARSCAGTDLCAAMGWGDPVIPSSVPAAWLPAVCPIASF